MESRIGEGHEVNLERKTEEFRQENRKRGVLEC